MWADVRQITGSRTILHNNLQDDAPDFRHMYFLKHKSEVFRFKEYESLISNKFGCIIKALQANNDREYSNEISKGI